MLVGLSCACAEFATISVPDTNHWLTRKVQVGSDHQVG